MKSPARIEPFIFRRAGLWLAKRSPVLRAARAHYAAFGLALGWDGLGLWRVFGGISPGRAAGFPGWLLDAGSGFYAGLWTALAALAALWAFGVFRRSGMRLRRRRPVRAAYAELLVFWVALAGAGFWPLALHQTALDTVTDAISDQELADDLRRLNNGAPLFAGSGTIIPAEEAFYLDIRCDAHAFENTLYWNMLHAPLDTVNDVIYWQNPEISPYRVNFAFLFHDKPIRVKELGIYGLPEDKAPFTLAGPLEKLARRDSWTTNPPWDHTCKAMPLKSDSIANEKRDTAYARIVFGQPIDLKKNAELPKTENGYILRSNNYLSRRAFWGKASVDHLFSLYGNKARGFDKFCGFLRELQRKRYSELKRRKKHGFYELRFRARDFLEARTVAEKEIFGRYVLGVNDWNAYGSNYFAIADTLYSPDEKLPASAVPEVSYCSVALPKKQSPETSQIYLAPSDYLVAPLLDETQAPETREKQRERETKRNFTREEVHSLVGGARSVLKKYGGDPGGLTPESVWRTQLAWDDTLTFPQAAYDRAAANIDRQIKQLHYARGIDRAASPLRRTLVLWGAFCLAALLQLALSVRLRTLIGVAGVWAALVAGFVLATLIAPEDSENKAQFAMLYVWALVGLVAGLLWLFSRVADISPALAARALLLFAASLPACPFLLARAFRSKTDPLLSAEYELFFWAAFSGALLYLAALPFLQHALSAARAQPEA